MSVGEITLKFLFFVIFGRYNLVKWCYVGENIDLIAVGSYMFQILSPRSRTYPFELKLPLLKDHLRGFQFTCFSSSLVIQCILSSMCIWPLLWDLQHSPLAVSYKKKCVRLQSVPLEDASKKFIWKPSCANFFFSYTDSPENWFWWI